MADSASQRRRGERPVRDFWEIRFLEAVASAEVTEDELIFVLENGHADRQHLTEMGAQAPEAALHEQVSAVIFSVDYRIADAGDAGDV